MTASNQVPSCSAIIFDCDGTLVDSEALSIEILATYLSELGWTIPVDEAIRRYSGQDLKVCMREAEEAIGKPLPPDAIEIFRSRQIPVLRRELRPIAGAAEVLRQIELPFCIASNAPQQKIQVCLDATGLRHHFDDERIFSAYDIELWKPNPALFLHAAERMGIAPDQCVVVEDSIFGIEASLAAGTQTVIYDPHDRFGEFDDDAVRVRHLTEILQLGCIGSAASV